MPDWALKFTAANAFGATRLTCSSPLPETAPEFAVTTMAGIDVVALIPLINWPSSIPPLSAVS